MTQSLTGSTKITPVLLVETSCADCAIFSLGFEIPILPRQQVVRLFVLDKGAILKPTELQ